MAHAYSLRTNEWSSRIIILFFQSIELWYLAKKRKSDVSKWKKVLAVYYNISVVRLRYLGNNLEIKSL